MRVRRSGERQLLAAILLQAVLDWRRVQHGEPRQAQVEMAHDLGLTAAGELESFFSGEWCRDVCQWLDLAPCTILTQMGVSFSTPEGRSRY